MPAWRAWARRERGREREQSEQCGALGRAGVAERRQQRAFAALLGLATLDTELVAFAFALPFGGVVFCTREIARARARTRGGGR